MCVFQRAKKKDELFVTAADVSRKKKERKELRRRRRSICEK